MHYTGLLAGAGAALLLAGAADSWIRRRMSPLPPAAHAAVLAGWLSYVWAFAVQDYTLRAVYEASSRGMPLAFRIASSWSGGGGSLLLFAAMTSAVALAHRARHRDPRLDAEYSALTAAAVALAFLDGAFESMANPAAAGAGLNPLLKSPWIYPHPLSTFAAYALISASAVSVHRGHLGAGDALARVGWVLLTAGLALGGYWSYVTFGWGGYWAWDPVETAELVPWLALTAALHVRSLDRGLSYASTMASAGSVFLAVLVTRVGVSPLHSFASPRSVTWALTASLAAAFLIEGIRGSGGSGIRNPAASPYRLGLSLAYLSLSMMFLILMAVLAAGALGGALGVGLEVPQMDAAVGFFHPVLFPFVLVLAASVTLCTLGGVTGWREVSSLLAGSAAVSAVLLHLSLTGRLTWSPASSAATNAMISVILPFVLAGLSSGLVSLYHHAAGRAAVLASLDLLHSAMALTLLGVLLSGPFAYNRSYFSDLRLRPGEAAEVGGVELELAGYNYEMCGGEVDVRTPYAGSPLHREAAAAASAVLEYAEALSEGYRDALELYWASRDGVRLEGTYSAEAEASPTSGGGESPEAVSVSVRDPEVVGSLRDWEGGATLEVEIRGEVSVSPEGIGRGQGGGLTLEFAEPLSLPVGGGRLEVARAVLLPGEGGSRLLVEDGSYLSPGGGDAVSLPTDVPGPGGSPYAGSVGVGATSDLIDVMESLGWIPPPPDLSPVSGDLPVPDGVPECARLVLRVRVGGAEREVEIRFDVNGEVQGIHGLVSQVVPVGVGPGDVYLVFNPPISRGRNWSVGFHELMVYYLSRAFRGMDEGQRLALTSLLAAAYLGAVDEGTLVSHVLELYREASEFDPAESTLRVGGAYLQVKAVPYVNLLWWGAALMVAGEVALTALSAGGRPPAAPTPGRGRRSG